MRLWNLLPLFFGICCLAQRFPEATTSTNPLSPRVSNYQIRFNRNPTTGLIDIDVSIHWTFSPVGRSTVIDEVFLTANPMAAGMKPTGEMTFSEVSLNEKSAVIEEIEPYRVFRVPLHEPCFFGRILTIRYRLRYAFENQHDDLFLHRFFPQVAGFSEQGWLSDSASRAVHPFGTFLLELPLDCPKPITGLMEVPWLEQAYYGADITTMGLYFSPSDFDERRIGKHRVVCSPTLDIQEVIETLEELKRQKLDYAHIKLAVIQGEPARSVPGIVVVPDKMQVRSAIIESILRFQVGLYETDSDGVITGLAGFLASGGVVRSSPIRNPWFPSWNGRRARNISPTRPDNLIMALMGRNPEKLAPCIDWCRDHAFALSDARRLLAEIWPAIPQDSLIHAPDLDCTAVSSRGFFYEVQQADHQTASPYLIFFGHDAWRLVFPDPQAPKLTIRTPEPINRMHWDPMFNRSRDIQAPASITRKMSSHAKKKRFFLMEWLRSAVL